MAEEKTEIEETFAQFTVRIQNYLINVTKYTQSQAKSFVKACEENGFDENNKDSVELIIDDFSKTYDDSAIITVEELKEFEDRKKLFQDIQKAIKSKSLYDLTTIINLDVTQIDAKIIKETKALYQKQAKSLITKDDDKNYFQVLALGRANDMPLLQNLADTYDRMRVNKTVKDNSDFKEKYQLFSKMRHKKTKETFQTIPASFHARGLPEARLDTKLTKIDDDLEAYCEWTKACIQFIKNLLSSNEKEIGSGITPFQVLSILAHNINENVLSIYIYTYVYIL